jgi:phosphoglycerol transferase MdoB-like AlkP superfamily enzyme
MVIIYATLSIAWLFRRRLFFFLLISTLWLILGIANGIILLYRMTPFTTADLQIIDMGLDILPNYLSTFQIVLLIISFVVVLILFALIFILVPKRCTRLNYKRVGCAIIVSCFLLSGTWFFGVKANLVGTYFQNLWDAYSSYGVPYCFINTWLNKGVNKPHGYGEKTVNAIFDEAERESITVADRPDFPNIVFLQLESFIDPSEIEWLEFSADPVPYFKELKENYSSGYLTVPVVGGGTANTEFEVMSGMSMKYFGPGEYPYKSVLKKKTCETMAYDLKKLGYATHAIHNHRGAFYDRNKVFKNIGFDDFTSLEYMSYVSKTPKGYATDDVLLGEIVGALESTQGKDYIYTITVQGHGEYPSRRLIDNPRVSVLNPKDNKQRNALEYYIQQVEEMDDFLRGLTEELQAMDEEVVLVLYGDHLPGLGTADSDMRSGSTFKTEYVIWSNFELEKEDKDLYAYQLSAELQRRIGMRAGTMPVFHQDKQGEPDYQEMLQLLQYDMLYGNRYVYRAMFGETNPFKPTDMRMGYKPIVINEIVEMAGQYYISGEGFTPYSKVSIDGRILDTVYSGPTVLKLQEKVAPSDVEKMKVSQVEKYNSVLSTTE